MTVRVPGRVSVVIPCFNAARYLRETIDGALAQTYGDVEIVVADDGSTDDSVAIVASYGDRVRGLRQGNAGPSAARNLALRSATGEFVALLDADDRFHPEKLARQVAVLRARPDASIVHCGWRFVDRDGRELPECGWPRLEGDVLERLVLGNLVHPVSVVLRRATIDDVGGFDERCPVNEDWDLFLRASRRGARWACVDAALCDYRVHPGQSHERLGLVHGVAIDILRRFFDDAARLGGGGPAGRRRAVRGRRDRGRGDRVRSRRAAPSVARRRAENDAAVPATDAARRSSKPSRSRPPTSRAPGIHGVDRRAHRTRTVGAGTRGRGARRRRGPLGKPRLAWCSKGPGGRG